MMQITRDRLAAILDGMTRARVLVIGDLVLDEHRMGVVARLSREAPVPVIEQRNLRHLPGGAGNLAANLCALGARVAVMGIVGEDRRGSQLVELIESSGADTDHIIAVAGRDTPAKLRIWASGDRQFNYQQVARIDTAAPVSVPATLAAEMAANLRAATDAYDALIFSDYEGGVVDPRLTEAAVQAGGDSVLRIADSHGGFERFRGFDALTPNQPEAEEYLGRRFKTLDQARAGAREMRDRLDCRQVLLTMGAQGVILADDANSSLHLPAVAGAGISDPSGAGDSVAAVFAAAQAAGAAPAEAACLANLAGAAAVSQIGVVAVSANEILAMAAEGPAGGP
jgi:D-beta-D-heptose 7-phosphate kinase/D-beta-D-heptose 1-phosphate adenosyltransferase